MSTVRCEDLSEELVAYLDGEQPEDERARIEAHVGTCLACRREIDRLTKVRGWVQDLPRIEPAGDFEERMWRRLEADAPLVGRPRGWRPAQWGVPALAAAAVLAFVLYSSIERADQVATAPPSAERAVVAKAPAAPPDQPAARAVEERVADAELAPEDLPPELLEHPEFFLRYPVVRRMNKLEHFEEVRRHDESEPLG